MQESIYKNRLTFLTAALALLLVLACSDHGLEPLLDSFITGRITYTGGSAAWPDTTEWVRIAAFSRRPNSVTEILLPPLPIFSDTLTRFVGTYDYQLRVPAGRYEWIVLAWKPRLSNPINPLYSGLDTLGIYFDPNNPTQYGVINIAEGQTVSGIDITADFSELTPPSPILNKPNAEDVAWRE
jgi:hypothetical protein